MKKAQVIPNKSINPSGTHLIGYIDASYAQLVKTFGKPNGTHDKYKVDAEWYLDTPAGIATIYNYKTGKNYCGSEGLAVEEITDWHIGGKSKALVRYIKEALFN